MSTLVNPLERVLVIKALARTLRVLFLLCHADPFSIETKGDCNGTATRSIDQRFQKFVDVIGHDLVTFNVRMDSVGLV